MDLDDTIVEIIRAAIPLILGYMAAWIRTTLKNRKETAKLFDLLKGAMQSLLRDRLIQAYNHYVEDKKWCPHYAKDSLSNMYKFYEALGQNGVMQHNMDMIMDLPEKDPKSKEVK